MKSEHGREGGTGRYTWTSDRLCTCGHRLSVHSAARTKVRGVIGQPCFINDVDPDVDCDCECFTPAKKGKKS